MATNTSDGGGRPSRLLERRSGRIWLGAGLAAVAAAVFVLAWFQPHKLFIDERVDEALPTAEPSATSTPAASTDTTPAGDTTTPPETVPARPVDLATGSFVSLDHDARGAARLLELADGQRFVRLEDFGTDNGPDLFVYLSTNPADGSEAAFDDDYVNLGRLEGNIGNQNYEVPAGTDVSRYASIVIWCDRFDSAFGAADLTTTASP